MSATAKGALAAYVTVCLIHLGAHVFGVHTLAERTQWVAVPCLVVAVIAQCGLRSRLAKCSAAGLTLCWVGDTLTDFVPSEWSFIALMGAFLVGHGFFIAGFWPSRRQSALFTPWMWAYALAAVVMVGVCAPQAGPLTIGIAVYAAALSVVAALAWGVDRLAGVGGVLFIISDALIAAREFVPAVDVPWAQGWIMLTYLSAVGLIALGVIRSVSAE